MITSYQEGKGWCGRCEELADIYALEDGSVYCKPCYKKIRNQNIAWTFILIAFILMLAVTIILTFGGCDAQSKPATKLDHCEKVADLEATGTLWRCKGQYYRCYVYSRGGIWCDE